MYRSYIKRSLDFMLAFTGMVVFIIPYVVIALLIKTDSKGPVLFKQKRICKGKKEFYILKFRTMYIDTPQDIPTHLLENPQIYITKMGRFLRKTSLDELPQIFNILWGQMSLVGPRPALWNQYDLITQRDRYGANDIRPGLTGLAQISGRDELSNDAKAAYDGIYVKQMSFFLDMAIILKTILRVLKRDGVIEGRKEEQENQEIAIR